MIEMSKAQRLSERLIFHCRQYSQKRGFIISPKSRDTLRSWIIHGINHTFIEDDIENVDFVEYAESLMTTLVSLAILDAKRNNSDHIENENFENAFKLLGPIWPFVPTRRKRSQYGRKPKNPNEEDLESDEDLKDIIRRHDIDGLKKFSKEDIEKFLKKYIDKLPARDITFLNEYLMFRGITRDE